MRKFNESNWFTGTKKVTFIVTQAGHFMGKKFTYIVESMEELNVRFGMGTPVNDKVRILEVASV